MDTFVVKRMAIYAMRRALTLGGAWLVERGWVEGAGWEQAVPGLALVLVDFGWSLYEKAKARKKAQSLEAVVAMTTQS